MSTQTDYDAMRRAHSRQKAALTRAVRTGDANTIRNTCRDAVRAWNATAWPDDWSNWQRALNDAEQWPNITADIADLDRIGTLDGLAT